MTRSRSRRSPRKGKSAPVSAKKQIYVSTEGQATEPDYVEYWHRNHRQHVVVVIDDFHGGPLQLVDRAIKRRQDDLREERAGVVGHLTNTGASSTATSTKSSTRR